MRSFARASSDTAFAWHGRAIETDPMTGDTPHHPDGFPDPPNLAAKKRRWLTSVAVFASGVAVVCAVYGTDDGMPGHDSFYHTKMAALLPEQGLLRTFPWLRFTWFTDEGNAFVSHHYGFHLLLAPMVHLSKALTGDYLPGARWTMCLMMGLTFLLLDRLLLLAGVRWRLIWLLLFVLMPHQFFIRHAYVRAIGPSLLCMLAITWALFARRHALAAVLIAVYIHIYLGGVVYAPVLVMLYVASVFVCGGDDRDRWRRMVAWTVAGWVIGLVTHPYAGGMWDFLRMQIFGTGLSPDIEVGREWKPYANLWWFAQMSAAVLITWGVALCLRLRSGGAIDARSMTLLLAHFLFLALTCKARRFVEYWPVFALLSSAYLAGPIVEGFAERLTCRPDAMAAGLRRARRVITGTLLIVIVGLLVWSPLWREIRRSVVCGYDLPAVRAAMEFLAKASEPGDVVFTDDWDVFPVYFYHNHHNHYIVGLDPKFTHQRRPDLWARYVKISRGQAPATVDVTMPDGADEKIHVTLDDIRDQFQAKFVITDSDHKALAARLASRDDLAELIYPAANYRETRNAPYLIFKVRQR